MSSSKLGEGGYGIVIPVSKFLKPGIERKVLVDNTGIQNDNVVKIFKRREYGNELDYKDTLNAYKIVQNSMGPNNGFRLNPYKNLTRKNLQKNTLNQLKKSFNTNSNDQDLYAVRMPHLGVSLWDVINKPKIQDRIRTIPFPIILKEIIRLLDQLRRLEKAGYIHGDIREPNIMIDQSTGTFTIIDFDLLKSVSKFRENISDFRNYNTPPEWLVNGLNGSMDLDKEVNDILQMITKPDNLLEWEDELNIDFIDYCIETYENYKYIDNIYSKTRWKKEVLQAIKDNYKFVLGENMTVPLKDRPIDGYDAYGFAQLILTFFNKVYSKLAEGFPLERIVSELEKAYIEKEGEDYTPEELYAIAKAIVDFTLKVLYPLSDLKISERISVEKAIDKAKDILKELESEFEEGKENAKAEEKAEESVTVTIKTKSSPSSSKKSANKTSKTSASKSASKSARKTSKTSPNKSSSSKKAL